MLTYFVGPEPEVVGVLRALHMLYSSKHVSPYWLTLLGTDTAYIPIALPSKLIALPIIMKSVKFVKYD